MRQIARVAIPMQQEHPGIHFHFYSAYADDVAEKLDKGLLDFGLMFEPFDMSKYETMRLPFTDSVGFLMREDHPLAKLRSVRLADLGSTPLLMPSQGQSVGRNVEFADDFDMSRLNIVAHYNLLFNAALMVEQGMGVALCLDHLADTTENTGLTFRPANPPIENSLRLAWKKYQIFSPAAELFLKRMREAFETRADEAENEL